MPDIFAADAKGDETRLHLGLAKINLLTLVYSVFVFLALAAVGHLLLGIVSESFRDGYTILLVIAAAMIPRAVFGPSTAIMSMGFCTRWAHAWVRGRRRSASANRTRTRKRPRRGPKTRRSGGSAIALPRSARSTSVYQA